MLIWGSMMTFNCLTSRIVPNCSPYFKYPGLPATNTIAVIAGLLEVLLKEHDTRKVTNHYHSAVTLYSTALMDLGLGRTHIHHYIVVYLGIYMYILSLAYMGTLL